MLLLLLLYIIIIIIIIITFTKNVLWKTQEITLQSPQFFFFF